MNKGFTCIAIDMGASSIRVMLGGLSAEGMTYREIHRISNEIVEMDGHDRWEMSRIEAGIRTGISKAIDSSATAPASIGVDSWGVDFVLVDEKGVMVEAPVAYRDSRTEGMQEIWEGVMPGLETFQRTGINFYIFNTLLQLLSIRDSSVIKQSAGILFIPGYINYLLSGRAGNELTIASTSQLLQVEDNQWDPAILEKLHLKPEMLGDIIMPGTGLGPATIPEASGTGMKVTAVCGHDTACVVAAIPVEVPDFAFISAGTWCIVGIESHRPLVSEEAFRFGLTNERGYGGTYRVEKNIVGLWLLQGLRKHLPADTSYADMELMVREAAAVDQVIDPEDTGFYNPADMKAAFDAYFEKTGQQRPEAFSGYLICAYDSLCFSFKYHVEKLEQLSGKSIEVLHLVGGGSQSSFLNQRIAAICQRKVISGPAEGAALGNIMIQAMAMGKIGSLREGRELVRRSCSPESFYPGSVDERTDQRYWRFLRLKEI